MTERREVSFESFPHSETCTRPSLRMSGGEDGILASGAALPKGARQFCGSVAVVCGGCNETVKAHYDISADRGPYLEDIQEAIERENQRTR